jgi:hypothetical protein
LCNPGIEDQNIDAIENAQRQLRFLRQLRGVGHVHGNYASVRLAAAERLNTLQFIYTPGGEYQLGSRAVERHSQGFPNA